MSWQAKRLARRIALDQAESWYDEWQRIAPRVPKKSLDGHPTRRIYLFWAHQVSTWLAV